MLNNTIKERQKPQTHNMTSLTYHSEVNTDCTRFHQTGRSATSSIFSPQKRTSYGKREARLPLRNQPGRGIN